jgi:hypothetical protein
MPRGYPVVSPYEAPGVQYSREVAASTTRQSISFPTGVRSATVFTSNASGSLYTYLVVNADNDADAIAKLALPTARIRLPVNQTFLLLMADDALCSRMDFATNAGTMDATVLGVADE